jgi:hypothetical protein
MAQKLPHQHGSQQIRKIKMIARKGIGRPGRIGSAVDTSSCGVVIEPESQLLWFVGGMISLNKGD